MIDRTAFEAWGTSFGFSVDRSDDGAYRAKTTDAMWGGWLAGVDYAVKTHSKACADWARICDCGKRHGAKVGAGGGMVNNTDKELLEMAAKSAGIDYRHVHDEAHGQCLWDGNRLIDWNPLTDDGDALRLEITLKLDAQWDVKSQTWGIYHVSKGFYIALARDSDRKRATTMAAAEIGRTM